MRHWIFIASWSLAVLTALPCDAATHRILAVRVDFPVEDPDHETTSGRGAFDLRSYADDPAVRAQYIHPWDVPPHDRRYFENHLTALSTYWDTVSDGAVDIDYEVWPTDGDSAYPMHNTFYKYGNGRDTDTTNEKLVALLHEALNACKTAEGSRIDLSAFDTFMVIHAGIGSETSGLINDIPSAFITAEDIGMGFVIDGKVIDNGLIVPEMTSQTGVGGLNGIMAQMFGHRLGLPSLSNNDDGMPAAGGWALMDTGAMSWGMQTRGFVPTHPCIWSKIDLGWVTPVVATADTTIDIAATDVVNGLPRAVKIPLSDEEYLLLENRWRPRSREEMPIVTFSDGDSSGVWLAVDHQDAYIPGSGLLVWHVNDRIIRDHRADNTVNDDEFRRGIDLLEADGIQDIGALLSFGDPRGENAEGYQGDLLSLDGKHSLTPTSNPDTGSMWGGASGVTVTAESAPGEVMRVTITFANDMKGFPVSVAGAEYVTAYDDDGDGRDLLHIYAGATVVLLNTDGSPAIPGKTALPPVFPHFTALPDTAVLGRYAVYDDTSADPYMAVLGLDATLYLGRLTDQGPDYVPYPIAAAPTFGPVITDLDRDGIPEIMVTAGAALRIYTPAGSFTEVRLDGVPDDAPALADIDRDGYPEVILGIGRRVWAYTHGGVLVAGFPFDLPPGNPDEAIVTSPLVADFDADGRLDIAVATTARRFVAFTPTGSPTYRFPLLMKALPASTPCLFHRAAGDSLGIAYLDDAGFLHAQRLTATAPSSLMPWPMWLGSTGINPVLKSNDLPQPAATALFEAFCYPNPLTGSTGTFRFTPTSATDCRITLYAADGRIVYEEYVPENAVIPAVANEVRFDASTLASGLYIAVIQTRTNTVRYKLGVLK